MSAFANLCHNVVQKCGKQTQAAAVTQAVLGDNNKTKKQQQSKSEPRIFTDYNVIECLGCGANGPVFKAQHRIDERQYAIKRIEYPLSIDKQNKLLSEVRKLATLDHRNVVRYHNSWFDNLNKEDNEKLNLLCNQLPSVEKNETVVSHNNNNISSKYLFIAMELCDSLTLKQWLLDNADRRNRSVVFKMFRQIVEVVNYFHNNGYVHKDLKPSKIHLYTNGNVKIDITPFIPHDGYKSLHLAPELANKKPYTEKIDIFSLGLILFEMLWPFHSSIMRENVLINAANNQFPYCFLKNYPQECEYIKSLLSKNPEERPTAAEILQHDLLSEPALGKLLDHIRFENRWDSMLFIKLSKTHYSFIHAQNFPNIWRQLLVI